MGDREKGGCEGKIADLTLEYMRRMSLRVNIFSSDLSKTGSRSLQSHIAYVV